MVFASTSDLATRLGRSFTAAETAQAAAILDDATAYLQSQIGQLVEAGEATVTIPVDPCDRRIRLPQWPVRSVDSVLVNGCEVTDFEIRDGFLSRVAGWPAALSTDPSSLVLSAYGYEFCAVTITFSYGLAVVPPELVSWACVLAAGVIGQVTRSGALSAAGVSSERVDDYAVNYETGSMPMSLPERVLDGLRASYGGGGHVSSSR